MITTKTKEELKQWEINKSLTVISLNQTDID
jgi:hypothetical protein